MNALPVIDPTERKPNTCELLPLANYDLVIVSFSGGKDSLALLLYVLEMGVPKSRVQLWHQCVDGDPKGGAGLMDWPCTESYCRAVAAALGVRILFQWKHGGIEREMLRENARTAPSSFERQDGSVGTAGGRGGKESTRLLFPQVSADLSVRWCSAYVKIDVAAVAVNNDPALRGKKILFLTGERRQESTARSRYAECELHRTNGARRTVHQWRAVIDWDESQVWEIIRRWRVVPHPAYRLGYGRVSCMKCIFVGPDEWATSYAIDPAGTEKVAAYEDRFGKTIKRGVSVRQQAARGAAFPEVADQSLVAVAMGHNYPGPVLTDDWQLPAGAYKRTPGPT